MSMYQQTVYVSFLDSRQRYQWDSVRSFHPEEKAKELVNNLKKAGSRPLALAVENKQLCLCHAEYMDRFGLKHDIYLDEPCKVCGLWCHTSGAKHCDGCKQHVCVC